MPFAQVLAAARDVLETASGAGHFSVWLAQQGATVRGFDVSAVAVEQATQLAQHYKVAERCVFEVADLDYGLPTGPPVDLAVCNMFRDPELDQPLIDRLKPRGLIAVAALSEVGAKPGRFRAKPGELVEAFAGLAFLGHGEGDGVAWLVAQKS